MKKFVALFVALFALSSCEIDGSLTVQQPLTMTAKKNQQITLQPGTYATEVEADSDKLQIEVKIGNDKKKITLRPANGQKIPKTNGKILIPAAQSGQAFDLAGEIATNSVSGRTYRGTESCTTWIPVYYCENVIVGHDRYGNPIWQRVCRTENRSVQGIQEVEYYPVTTTTDVDMAFLAPGTDAQLADFAGSRSSTQNHYTYRGYCNAYGYPRYP